MKQNQFKRKFYIACFVLLGLLVGLVVHGVFEMLYIYLLTTNFAVFSLGLTWGNWFTVHKIWSMVTFFGGILFGYYQGKYWWRIVYEQRKLDPFFRKVRKFFHLPPAKN